MANEFLKLMRDTKQGPGSSKNKKQVRNQNKNYT